MSTKLARVFALTAFLFAACAIPGPGGQPVVLPFLPNIGPTPEPQTVVLPQNPGATSTPFLPTNACPGGSPVGNA